MPGLSGTGLCFVHAKRRTTGGPDAKLKHPASVKKTTGDGNCLFRALCYIITGSVREHFKLGSLIVEHMRSTEACMTLLVNYIKVIIEEYTEASHMDQDGAWGTTAEMLLLARMLEANRASYNSDDKRYQVYSLGVIDYEAYGEDNSRYSLKAITSM